MILPIQVEKINALATLAGKAIMEIYAMEDFSEIVDYKSDHSPLTLADKKANKIILDGLQSIYPEIPIISEEEALPSYEERKAWKWFWLVDPLDGTKEFIKRNGEFTVNIALIFEGSPVMGVIYVPATEVLYYSSIRSGAFSEFNGRTSVMKVSQKKQGLVSIGSRSHSSNKESEVLSAYPISEYLTAGSSLKFCRIAEGFADIYYRGGPTMEWDIAAGHAIVEAAGGCVLDENGLPFRYNKANLLNGPFLCLGRQFDGK